MKKTLAAAAVLAALLIPAAPAFAEPGDSTDTSTSTETDSGERTIGDVIHDIFCPPEDDEEDEAEEPAAAPEPPTVTYEAPAKPETTEVNDEPVKECSTDPRSVNYCPPLVPGTE